MRCEECLAAIDEYVEGELGEAAASQVSAHIAACALCSHHYEDLIREQKMYAQYLLDVEATPALWAGLEAGIREVKAARASRLGTRLRRWFAAPFGTPRLSHALTISLALITIGITVSIVRYMNSHEATRQDNISQKSKSAGVPSPSPASSPSAIEVNNDPGSRADSADNIRSDSGGSNIKRGNLTSEAAGRSQKSVNLKPEISRREPITDEVVRRTERQYLAAITVLSRDFDRRRMQLDSNVVTQLENALAELDRTIVDTRRAVREHPRDPVIIQYMMTAYAKKVDVLRQLTSS